MFCFFFLSYLKFIHPLLKVIFVCGRRENLTVLSMGKLENDDKGGWR